MIYRKFRDKQLSMLGFGTMRLPTNPDGSINEALTEEMVDRAIKGGINYFDTAYPYHDGHSELVIGRLLNKYPRESWYLADKFPGHQTMSSYDPEAMFEEQLNKCGVDYFDFYLLHNVCERSLATYLNEDWKIIDYFIEQRKTGRIKHLGFSTHGSTQNIREFLDLYGEHMEFCQIQLNWLDFTLQDGEGKVKLLCERGIPVWVMEPVRGGKLCRLDADSEAKLKALRPDDSIASWGFRYLESLPGVTMVLSGMSDMAQLDDNLRTFDKPDPTTEADNELLYGIAETMKDSVPCTACRYCTAGCPKGIDIPLMLSIYNDIRFSPTALAAMRIDGQPEDKRPEACIKCGKCTKICPQSIDIPAALSDLCERVGKFESWDEICRKREEAAKKLSLKIMEANCERGKNENLPKR
nr:aldo/keto reductase [Clostridia bacterium]